MSQPVFLENTADDMTRIPSIAVPHYYEDTNYTTWQSQEAAALAMMGTWTKRSEDR